MSRLSADQINCDAFTRMLNLSSVWLSNCGMLIDPYLNEGLISDRNLLRLTAQGGATQMAQPQRGHQRKTERNKDVISMLSNVRIKTLF